MAEDEMRTFVRGLLKTTDNLADLTNRIVRELYQESIQDDLTSVHRKLLKTVVSEEVEHFLTNHGSSKPDESDEESKSGADNTQNRDSESEKQISDGDRGSEDDNRRKRHHSSDSSREDSPPHQRRNVKKKKVGTSSERDAKEDSDESVEDSPKKKTYKKGKKEPSDSDPEEEERTKIKKNKEKKAKKKEGKSDKKTAVSKDDTKTPHVIQLERIARHCSVLPMCRNYANTFGHCQTANQRVQILKKLLQDAGMEGIPSMEKAEQLKLLKEAAELDPSNILRDRSRRRQPSGRCEVTSSSQSSGDNSKQSKSMFSRLKGIIDSEEDSD